MMNCRLCKHPLDLGRAIEIDVPAGTQLFSEDVDVALSLKSRIAILKCAQCALIQLAGDPVVYENVSSSSSFVSAQLTEHRLAQLQALLEMRPGLGAKGSILEIGCGDGHLLAHANTMFARSVGIEPTRRNAQAASERGLSVYQMLMEEDAAVDGAPFHYFCSFHVLEHVTDVCSVLKGIRNNLADGAVGIIEVPATDAALANRRFGDFMPDHLNYFTEATLRMALEWNGFNVTRIYRDWGAEHLVAYASKRANQNSSLAFIAERQESLAQLVAEVNATGLPFAIWGVSHHVMPYMSVLAGIERLVPVDGSPSKIGRYIPSTKFQVKPIATLSDLRHAYVAITAPRFRDEISAELATMFTSIVLHPALSDKLGFEVLECRAASAL